MSAPQAESMKGEEMEKVVKVDSDNQSASSAAGSAPQRTCGGCGGFGANATPEHLDIALNAAAAGRRFRMRAALRLDAKRNPCPICAGRSTVDAKASRADALADAESLEQIGGRIIGREPFNAIESERFARAAFQACPGLRG